MEFGRTLESIQQELSDWESEAVVAFMANTNGFVLGREEGVLGAVDFTVKVD